MAHLAQTLAMMHGLQFLLRVSLKWAGNAETVVGVLSSPLEDFQLGVYGDRSLIRANVSCLLFKSGH